MLAHSLLEGQPLRSGDLILNTDGAAGHLGGRVWRLFGVLVPGPVDHVAMYVGPGGRCVESGPLGVVAYEVPGGRWRAESMAAARGWLLDSLYGIGDPLAGRGLAPEDERRIRLQAAAFCLAQVGKPYNLNFFNPHSQRAFYCSQLIYMAYLQQGIDLDPARQAIAAPAADLCVYPQEIWLACGRRWTQRLANEV
jgi:uncharacterized protein YycO